MWFLLLGCPKPAPVPVIEAPKPVRPLTVVSSKPQHIDEHRGGWVTLYGTGLTDQTHVRIGTRTVPIVQNVRDDRLRVRVDDMLVGLYDIEITGPNGSAVLERALMITTGPVPEPHCATAVWFEHDSAELSGRSLAVLTEDAFCFTVYLDPVHVIGHTDSTGDASYNSGLGQSRAEAVAAALTELGVDPERLVVRTAGESGGDRDPSARRVDVRVERP